MSQADRMFNLGGLFMIGLTLFGRSIYWFITPAHVDASQAWTAAVVGQAVVGLMVATYAWTRRKRELAAD